MAPTPRDSVHDAIGQSQFRLPECTDCLFYGAAAFAVKGTRSGRFQLTRKHKERERDKAGTSDKSLDRARHDCWRSSEVW